MPDHDSVGQYLQCGESARLPALFCQAARKTNPDLRKRVIAGKEADHLLPIADIYFRQTAGILDQAPAYRVDWPKIAGFYPLT